MAAPAWKAKGTFQSGTGALTVPFPTSGTYAIGDQAFLVVESANQAISTPSGWSQVTNSPQSTGTAAAAGGVRLAVFTKTVASTSEASVSVADTGDHTTAQIHVTGPCVVHVTAGSVLATAGTTITLPTVTTTLDECLILLCLANDRDSNSTTNLSSWTNANLLSLTEWHDQTVISGVGGGIGVATGWQQFAGSTGTTTVTNAASVTAAMLTIALRPKLLDAEHTASTTAVDAKDGDTGSFVVESVPISGKGFDIGGLDGNSTFRAIASLNYATEAVAAVSATLSVNRYSHASASGTNKGYAAGTSSYATSLEGFVYATETVTSQSATLAAGRANFSGVSSQQKGYFGGGQNGAPAQSEIDGIDFSSETAVNPAAALVSARYRLASVNSSTNGYWCGGTSDGSSRSAEIDGIVFATEASHNPSAGLTYGTYGCTGVSSPSAGYICGGWNSFSWVSIEKITFSSDTVFRLSASLPRDQYSTGSAVQTLASGYKLGGSDSDGKYADIAKVSFATDTCASLGATLPTTNEAGAGVSAPVIGAADAKDGTVSQNQNEVSHASPASATDAGNAGIGYPMGQDSRGTKKQVGSGYWCGGHYNDPLSWVDKILFATEATSTIAASLTTPVEQATSSSDKHVGFVYGGYYSLAGIHYLQTTEALLFKTETISQLAARIGDALYGSAATSTDYEAYLGGGVHSSLPITDTYKFNYRTKAFITLSAVMINAWTSRATASSSTKGYYVGGWDINTSVATAGIEAITFSSEAISSVTASLRTPEYQAATCQTTTVAYFGLPSSQGVDKFVFGTEAITNIGAKMPTPDYNGTGGNVSDEISGYLKKSAVNTVAKFAFITETWSYASSVLPNYGFSSSTLSSSPIPAIDEIVYDNVVPASRSEAGTLAAAFDADVGQTIEYGVGSAAATENISALALFLSSLNEPASSSEVNAATAVMFTGNTEASGSTDVAYGSRLSLESSAEPGSAAASTAGIVSYPAARSEAATSTEQESAVFVAVAQGAATASSADSPGAVYAAVSATTESAAPVDAPSALAGFVSAFGAAASAADAANQTTGWPASDTETSAAVDAPLASAQFVGSLGEPATASESPTTAVAAPVARAEPAPGSDSSEATAALAAQQNEAESAAAVQDGSAFSLYVVSHDAATAATDGPSAVMALVCSFSSGLTATDSADATLPTQAYQVSVTESVSADAVADRWAVFPSTASEAVTAQATEAYQLAMFGAAAGDVTAGESQSVVAVLVAALGAQGDASDQTDSYATFVVLGSEQGAADAVASSASSLLALVEETALALGIANGSLFSNLYIKTVHIFVQTSPSRVFVDTEIERIDVPSLDQQIDSQTYVPRVFVATRSARIDADSPDQKIDLETEGKTHWAGL